MNAAMALVMAPACAACRAVLEEPLAGAVCAGCWSTVRTCTLEWRHDGDALQRVISAGPYDGTLRDIIHAWKFEGRQSLARPLAHLVRLHCSDTLDGADIAVPVPMTPWRKWHRGFNQAEDLARHLGVPRVRLLARLKPRAAQSTLTAAARRRNVDTSVFVPAWRRPAVRNQIVVLVDDVVTTGATLEACARVLHAAGAKEVRAVTVAQTVLRVGATL